MTDTTIALRVTPLLKARAKAAARHNALSVNRLITGLLELWLDGRITERPPMTTTHTLIDLGVVGNIDIDAVKALEAELDKFLELEGIYIPRPSRDDLNDLRRTLAGRDHERRTDPDLEARARYIVAAELDEDVLAAKALNALAFHNIELIAADACIALERHAADATAAITKLDNIADLGIDAVLVELDVAARKFGNAAAALEDLITTEDAPSLITTRTALTEELHQVAAVALRWANAVNAGGA